jgi:hypothetical protein
MAEITADELYEFICANAEEIEGQLICRQSLWAELGRRGIPRGPTRQQLRMRLVKQLEARGLIKRIHPRSRYLVVLQPDSRLVRRVRREHFQARMEDMEIEFLAAPYEANKERTTERISQLESYMARSVLGGKSFVCTSWRECESSIGLGCTFKEGQMSHVGKHFDLSRDGRDLRIVVVGQEVAGKGKPHTTMDGALHKSA